MDDRERKELRTKVEIMDETEVSRDQKDVPEFLKYYNDRYDKMRTLTHRMELQSATTINRLERREKRRGSNYGRSCKKQVPDQLR